MTRFFSLQTLVTFWTKKIWKKIFFLNFFYDFFLLQNFRWPDFFHCRLYSLFWPKNLEKIHFFFLFLWFVLFYYRILGGLIFFTADFSHFFDQKIWKKYYWFSQLLGAFSFCHFRCFFYTFLFFFNFYPKFLEKRTANSPPQGLPLSSSS